MDDPAAELQAAQGRAGADAYDGPLSALATHAEDLGTWLGIWCNRAEPDAHARRCASDAVDAIDSMLRDLHKIRARLIGEIRRSDDLRAAAVDELLARLHPGES